MPRKYLTGTAGLTRVSKETTFDPVSGWTTTERFQCAKPETIQGVLQEWASAGKSITCIDGESHTDITVRTGGLSGSTTPEGQSTDTPVDSYQLLGNEIQRSIWEHPIALKLQAHDRTSIGYIRHRIEKATTSSEYDESVFDSFIVAPGGSVTLRNYAVYLYRLGVKGVEHYALGQYVLRHSRTVGDRTTLDFLDDNVEEIYTTSDLLAELTSASLTYPLPKRLQNKIDRIEKKMNTFTVDGYRFGWRKLPSTETTVAGNRLEISTEYWLERWNVEALYKAK
jgi:hypothetical protein